MKTDRLVSMIFLLLKRKKISARELADYYNCSVRTIYRDMESLESAGVPIVSYRGAEGGFELIEGYRIDKPFLSSQEASIVLGLLQEIRKVVDDVEFESISSKMNGAEAKLSNLTFDMKGWGMSADFRNKVNQINQSITDHRQIMIEYAGVDRDDFSHRTVYPLKIMIKGSQWYLHAFCALRDDYRMFKIKRIKSLRVTQKTFDPKRYQPIPDHNPEWSSQVMATVTLKFHNSVYSSFKEYFLEENIITYEQDHFIVKTDFPMDNWTKGMILSYGPMVEVLEPLSLREDIKKAALEILSIYDKT